MTNSIDISMGLSITGSVGAPSGAPLWRPSDLGSALKGWWDMSLLAGANGSTVTSIPDQSGNSRTGTSSGSNHATLAAANQNGLNALRFTGGQLSRYALASANTIMGASTSGSMYVVFKVVSDSVDNSVTQWGQGAGNHWSYSNGDIYDDFGKTGATIIVGNPTVTLTTYRIVSIYSAASDYAWYIDGGTGGSAGGTSAFYSTATNTVGWSSSAVYIGTDNSFVHMDGHIAEILVTNAKQSVADRQKVEGYLAHKWGLTANLSASHPYKTAPPTTAVAAGSDASFSSTRLVLNMQGANGGTTFTDNSPSPRTMTPSTVTTVTAQFKYGTSSALFNGTSSYLETTALPTTTFDQGSLFTYEGWFRFASVAGDQVFFTNNATPGSYGSFLRYTGGSLDWFNWSTGQPFSNAWAAAINTWYHIAVARDGTTTRMFIDGSPMATTNAGSQAFTAGGGFFGIGAGGITSRPFNGWCGGFRFTNGVCRYTTAFTPPTALFPTS